MPNIVYVLILLMIAAAGCDDKRQPIATPEPTASPQQITEASFLTPHV